MSRTLENASWANTQVVGGDFAGEVSKLEEQPSKEIVIMGSSDVTVSLLHEGLVDEVRIMLNPIVLGNGNSLFRTTHTAGSV